MKDPGDPRGASAATALRLIGDGAEAFSAMFAAVDGARSCVLLEMYIFAADATGREMRDRLAAAAGRGVEVLVLVDAWGSWRTPETFWAPLRASGAAVRLFHPIRRGLLPFRNHRKLLLVDNRTAFLGGLNVADEYRTGKAGAPPWRDFQLEVSGPEAAGLRRSFLRLWALAERRVRIRTLLRIGRPARDLSPAQAAVRFVSSGPGERQRLALHEHRRVIRGATATIDLAMSYFFPPGRILRELRRAVRRGVRVRLLAPRSTDVPPMRWAARGIYGRLLRAGIEIREYLPAVLHAKLAVADDTVVVGSANLDLRSDRLNHELIAVVRDAGLAAVARRELEADFARAERISLEDWRRRPLLQKLKERLSYWLVARADIVVSRMEFLRTRW